MIAKKLTVFFALVLGLAVLTACNPSTYAANDQKIISARKLNEYIGKGNVVLVDMQSAADYAASHVEGAVNIRKDELVISVPVDNMLTTGSRLEELLGANGIKNDTLIVAYDSNKMDASRFFWTMLMYGSENVKVVDGGIAAIRAAGVKLTDKATTITPAAYKSGGKANPVACHTGRRAGSSRKA